MNIDLKQIKSFLTYSELEHLLVPDALRKLLIFNIIIGLWFCVSKCPYVIKAHTEIILH